MPFASPYPDIAVPDVSVPDFILGANADRPDAVALVDGARGDSLTYGQLAAYVDRVAAALVDGARGDQLTYGQLAAYVDRVAAALVERGLQKGDRVAIFSPNTAWYPVVFHGIARAGLVSTTINSLYTPDEIAFQLKDSGAKMLVTVSPFLDLSLIHI